MRGFVLSLLFALAGCAQASREEVVRVSAAAVWLDAVGQAHAQAERSGREQARHALETVRALPVPAAVAPDDARRVLQDLQFRLAALALAGGDPARALDEAERGLGLGRAEDGYTANLLIVQGRAAEAVGRGDAAAAAYAAARALHERLLSSEE